MTLCVALATPRMVIHVSDRRVSWIRGSRIVDIDDHRNKAIIFTGGSLRALIAFCGVAALAGMRRDRWIVKTLTSLVANPSNHSELWRHFANRLSEAYAGSVLKRGPRTHVGLEVIVTAFSHNIVLNITLQALLDGRVSVQFHAPGDLPVKSGFHRYFMVRAIGSGSSLFYERYLEQLRFSGKAGRFKPKNVERLRDQIAHMIKEISVSPRSKGLVGGNCVASALLYPSRSVFKYYPIDPGDPYVYLPLIINGTMFAEISMRKVTATTSTRPET